MTAYPLAVVPVARVERTTITGKTVLTAEFQPFQEVDVMAKVAGYLRSIKVDLGDRVREGQTSRGTRNSGDDRRRLESRRAGRADWR